MPRPFAITAASNSIFLDDRSGEARFTVSNQSGRSIRGRGRVITEEANAESWVSIRGPAEREFTIAGTEQYTVSVKVPPKAQSGNYTVRLDMIGEERPDEQYVEGPAVTFYVPEPEEEPDSFPWMMVAAIVAVLTIGGLIAFLLWPRGGTTHETTTLETDPSLSAHYWRSRGGGSRFVDLDRSNYRVGVSRQEDLPPAGESISILTFPIRDLRNDEIAFAELRLGMVDVVGDPFSSHGDLLIEEVSYADLTIAPHALSPQSVLHRLPQAPTEPGEGVRRALDITEALDAALERGSQRFQIRIRFEDVELEDINAELAVGSSYLEWNREDVYLEITILVPFNP